MSQKALMLLFGLLVLAITGVGFFSVEFTYADGPPGDYACRGCHGNNQRELTLPSEETLSLHVPLGALNNSPHNLNLDMPVLCQDCHRTRIHYQYPHQPLTAQTRQDFRRSTSEQCQDCHYPHSPLHAPDQPDPESPVCVDCHGSHEIDYADDILNSMPSACIACHTEQTSEWATDFIAPRLGVGQAAEGYVGSDRCGGCHEEKYFSWRETLHAKMIQDPTVDLDAVVGDFNQPDTDLTFSRDVVSYTIGNRWKQQYITKSGADEFHVLPAQWNIEAKEWVSYASPDEDWRQACGSCHVTGLDTQTWGFAEFGVGCESCHGMGADHANDPENVNLFTEVDDQVCGACHSRGVSPDGFDFPATYRPGDTLTDHFTFTSDKNDLWPDGSAKKHHQQYIDWQQNKVMRLSGKVNCVTCHAVHDSGTSHSQLIEPIENLCIQCHSDKKAIINHTPYHDQAINNYQFNCADCHMPNMAINTIAYDGHNHTFHQPDPETTLEQGGPEVMFNACNGCHTTPDESAQWAADTVAYVKTIVTPAPISFFGPGPTPTSPPVPTPLPSVGEPAKIYRVETGYWLRILLIFGSILAVFGSLYLGTLIWFDRTPKGDDHV
ncbi:cytochrome c3 family protein [Anaerolineales bacterium HSG6]|nr:cytochrome c3 family protein [Anaerolineales bacterium HSG6]MDM8531984.1 cytochrome c3 family protein [Anaerolineales bacterium HSG25]